ncbi:DUF5358 domain-containing protein [Basfia succiniciproducens]|uniref:DUF5358 domain-containing protein n=1 Tax=Basfia succiniciproducens TaxID=653940 RepID=UPI0008D03EAD|nr:DUF5358 domain-containing protein [Basfia succiniciproducens]SEQ51361.1 hypothetical protein SAMN02910415_01595 [Basfia succiniciproducens]
MLNKIFLSGVALLLAGCAAEQAPIPAQFAGADYQLSDKDAKQWVALGKRAESCIYPNLTRIQQEHFAKEDSYIYSQYVFFYPLEDVIGSDAVKIIEADQQSMDYATYQFKKFKQSDELPKLDELTTAQCNTLRIKAREDLAVVKGQRISAMVEDTNTTGGTSNANKVGTEDNKFFFDIIKWGSALLL